MLLLMPADGYIDSMLEVYIGGSLLNVRVGENGTNGLGVAAEAKPESIPLI